jgi:hypothetical protein
VLSAATVLAPRTGELRQDEETRLQEPIRTRAEMTRELVLQREQWVQRLQSGQLLGLPRTAEQSSSQALSVHRAEVVSRIAERRTRVDLALAQAREAANALQTLRTEVVSDARGPFDEARERSSMMQLVRALAVAHQGLLRRYQELQLEVSLACVAVWGSNPRHIAPLE